MITRHRSAWKAVETSSDPILVFQMGKVGSKSIVAALSQHAPKDVFHAHRLDPFAIPDGGDETNRDHQYVGLALFHYVVVPERPAKIVTIVRDPIARNLSAYFHRPRNKHTAKAFVKRYSHDIALGWYDKHFQPVLGIDVYEHSFNHDLGWSVIDHPRWPTLLLRAETPDEIKAAALGEFTGMPVTEIPRVNEGSRKQYADRYRSFMKDLVLPEEYVDRMLDAKLTRHFFAEHERRALREKWNYSASQVV